MNLLKRALDRAHGDDDKAVLSAESGTLAWSELGDGVMACDLMRDGVEQAWKLSGPEANGDLVWQSTENLMLLSSSYDEYERWSDRLRALKPDAEILRGQYPRMMTAKEDGLPWLRVMIGMAQSQYDTNRAKDRGQYGRAASTFHVLLTKRRTLRVDHERWKGCVYEFGKLRLRLATDTRRKALRLAADLPPDEHAPIVTGALPLVDEYLVAHPEDADVTRLKASMLGEIEDWGI